jgi:NADH-ubiquinone oxidoreductase chain 5
MGYYKLAFFHLLTHALYKAVLFMCAGVIIHNLNDCQDIRCIRGLVHHLPLTVSCFCVSNLALCGMPFLAVFYSKDLILEVSAFVPLNIIIFLFYFVSTGLTACYTARLIYCTIVGEVHLFNCNSISDEG